MRLPVNPGQVLDAALAPGARDEGQSLGEHLLRTCSGSGTSPRCGPRSSGCCARRPPASRPSSCCGSSLTGTILGRIAQAGPGGRPGAGGQDAEYRAALVASQVLGLGLTRYVLEVEPLAQASAEDLIAAIGPTWTGTCPAT